jgi:hypothetical protein
MSKQFGKTNYGESKQIRRHCFYPNRQLGYTKRFLEPNITFI